MKEIKGILFDKDGTLLDFNSIWVPVACKLLEELINDLELFNTVNIYEKMAAAIGIDGDRVVPGSVLVWGTANDISREIQNVIYKENIKNLKAEDFGMYVRNKINKLAKENRELIKPNGNVEELMIELKRRGVCTGLATADTFESSLFCLDKLNITRFFDYFGTDDGNTKSKPDPEHLLKFCKICGIKPEEVAVVGDSEADMSLAVNGNAAYAIAILSGTNHPEKFTSLADFTLNSIEEIISNGGKFVWNR